MEERDRNKRTLVIGLGNPLMGDDSFGTSVIEHLRLEPWGRQPHVDLVDAHTDLLGQIDRFAAYEQVVLVDALLVAAGNAANAGRVLLLEEKAMHDWPETSSSAHQLSPLAAVRLFRCLYPHAPTQIRLVGLCTAGLSFGPGAGTAPGGISAGAIDAAAGIVSKLLE